MSEPLKADVQRFSELELDLGEFHLRPMLESDKELILKNYNEELIQRWMGIASPFLEDNFTNWLAFQRADQERGGGIWWVIEQDGIPLGQIWFRRQKWADKISEIGYLAFPESRGKGMIPFLTRELAKLALLKYQMNRVEIWCDKENVNSGRAAEKAGFTYEGTMRKALFQRGVALDSNVYSMIAEDI